MKSTSKIIAELGRQYPKPTSKQKTQMIIYECPSCFKHVRASMQNYKIGKCNRCKGCATTIHKTTHGESKTRVHEIWGGIKKRCFNSKYHNFRRYGGRGITMCDEWKNSYEAFRDWALENGYKDDLSIDRRDNDGNYEPSNCRWTNQCIQSQNTIRLNVNNKSGYRGVSLHSQSKKWVVYITSNKHTYFLGSFDDKEEGARVYDKFVIDNNFENTLNFAK